MTEKEMLRPNVAVFAARLAGEKQSAAARRLGISEKTLRVLLGRYGETNERRVSRSIIEHIASKLEVDVISLILPDDREWLPHDPQYYSSLQHGYYIDHDRSRSGALRWFGEAYMWSPPRPAATGTLPLVQMAGTLRAKGGTFAVEGELFSERYFTIAARDRLRRVAFNAVFVSWRMSGETRVLCGSWCGITHAGMPCAYRMFLSPERLGLGELAALSCQVRIACALQADELEEFEERSGHL